MKVSIVHFPDDLNIYAIILRGDDTRLSIKILNNLSLIAYNVSNRMIDITEIEFLNELFSVIIITFNSNSMQTLITYLL